MTREETVRKVGEAMEAAWRRYPDKSLPVTRHIIYALEYLELIKFDDSKPEKG